jgi:hypothetical protein
VVVHCKTECRDCEHVHGHETVDAEDAIVHVKVH